MIDLIVSLNLVLCSSHEIRNAIDIVDSALEVIAADKLNDLILQLFEHARQVPTLNKHSSQVLFDDLVVMVQIHKASQLEKLVVLVRQLAHVLNCISDTAKRLAAEYHVSNGLDRLIAILVCRGTCCVSNVSNEVLVVVAEVGHEEYLILLRGLLLGCRDPRNFLTSCQTLQVAFLFSSHTFLWI